VLRSDELSTVFGIDIDTDEASAGNAAAPGFHWVGAGA
jgi:hypothetical protein